MERIESKSKKGDAMPSNPFIFGGPVHGEAFLNRKRELRRLVTRIQQGGSAVITADLAKQPSALWGACKQPQTDMKAVV
jgi:hypothetical protein